MCGSPLRASVVLLAAASGLALQSEASYFQRVLSSASDFSAHFAQLMGGGVRGLTAVPAALQPPGPDAPQPQPQLINPPGGGQRISAPGGRASSELEPAWLPVPQRLDNMELNRGSPNCSRLFVYKAVGEHADLAAAELPYSGLLFSMDMSFLAVRGARHRPPPTTDERARRRNSLPPPLSAPLLSLSLPFPAVPNLVAVALLASRPLLLGR